MNVNSTKALPMIGTAKAAAPQPQASAAFADFFRKAAAPAAQPTPAAQPAPAPLKIAVGSRSAEMAGIDFVNKCNSAVRGDPKYIPRVEEIFGETFWVESPQARHAGGFWNINPLHFATDQTAAKLAEMLGGKAVQRYDVMNGSGPFYQTQPNNMIELRNGVVLNAGLLADIYNHGYPQSFIDRQIASMVSDASGGTVTITVNNGRVRA